MRRHRAESQEPRAARGQALLTVLVAVAAAAVLLAGGIWIGARAARVDGVRAESRAPWSEIQGPRSKVRRPGTSDIGQGTSDRPVIIGKAAAWNCVYGAPRARAPRADLRLARGR